MIETKDSSVLTEIQRMISQTQIFRQLQKTVIQPWDYWLTMLDQEYGNRASDFFAKVQRKTLTADLYGFIIVWWDEDDEPCKYWSGAMFKSMNDPAETPYPYIFRTLAGAKRVIKKFREMYKWGKIYPNIGLFFWISPEAGEISLARWNDLRLTASGPKIFGNCFPGCPRR